MAAACGRQKRILPQVVLHMLRILALVLWLAPGVFLAGPLTADDLYGAPDPGWYNQGSGYRSIPDSSGDGDGYGQDLGGSYHYDDFRTGADYKDDAGGYSPYGWSRDSGATFFDPAEGYRDAPWHADADRPSPDQPPPRSPNGYGAPDWAQEPLPRQRRASEAPGYWSGDEGYGEAGRPGGRSVYADGYRDGGRLPDRRRYRFRDDPSLGQHVGGGTGADYRFRPLTPKEQERHHSGAQGGRFADRYDDRRYRPRDEDERGTTFGYAPGRAPVAPPDDFYRRYYRSGP
jgi:hypothetical protein